MSKRNLILKIGSVASTVLFSFAICASKIAFENKSAINEALKAETYKVVKNETSTEVDSEYFKSSFKNLKELVSAGKKLAADVEAEGAVLLKNDNKALPLTKNSKINLIGVSSIDPAYSGKGSATSDNPLEPVTPEEGFTSAGFEVNEKLLSFYKSNPKYKRSNGRGEEARINDAPWDALAAESGTIESIADYKEAAIFTISRSGGGEGRDLAVSGTDGENGDYLKLNANEKSILKGLKSLKDQGKLNKIVVLINSANPLSTKFLYDEEFGIDAALWVGTTGVTGFESIAKICSGDINPSGHLSDTFWLDNSKNPVVQNIGDNIYPNAADFELPKAGSEISPKYSTYVAYQEGIYLGYRYAETRYADVIMGKNKNVGDFDYYNTISHPFGYGQSYTTFEYSDYSVSKKNNIYTVSVKVTNTGDLAGKDAVQVYVQKPYNDRAIERGIEVPAVDLVGFDKTKLLAPGESEVINIDVDERDFAVYDAEVDKTYIINDGDYYLTAASDSHQAIKNILAAQGYNTEDTTKNNGNDNLDLAGNKNLTYKKNLNFDNSKYSLHEKTNARITNLFDDADINRYSGKGKNKITYMSRNNWKDTVPTKPAEIKMTNGLVKDLLAQDDMSLVEKGTGSLPKYGANNGMQLINLRADSEGNKIPYNDTLWDQFLDQLTWEQTCDFVSSGYRKTAGIPSLGKPETIDHNGPQGITSVYGKFPNSLAKKLNDPDSGKYSAPYYPCLGILSATFNTDLATKFGEMLGEDALWVGYSGFYGIAINTHRSPYEGRAYEYLSEDSFLTGEISGHQAKALQEKGCYAYIKHFALNEQETNRNGVSIWANEQTLRQIYLKSFEKVIEIGDAHAAMASFTRIGAKYCPASSALLTDFLRNECGFMGFVVTDMYGFAYSDEHMPTFIMAGTDIPDGDLKTNPFADFKKYPALANAMRESAHRILYTVVHSNAMNGIDSNTTIIPITPTWIKATYATDIVLGVLWLGFMSASVVFYIKDRKRKED